jgi:L-aspartate oxidase
MITTDYLVIGSGVAGLSFALQAATKGKVMIMTKTYSEDSNTWWAQGGIAGVFDDEDTFSEHIDDTLIAGDGLCNPAVVAAVVTQGPARIEELIQYGVQFDRQADGTLALGREGGHSHNRILHNKDATGKAISQTLIEAARQHPNIEIVENLFAVDLLTQHHLGLYVNRGNPNICCFGVYALNTQTQAVTRVLAKYTILASGGAGNVYANTTNPSVATGDGIAMVLRAKGRIANMEFYQFHPTAFYEPGIRPAFLITEAMRGAGAILRNSLTGERFMSRYDERMELAPRDVVARAIDNEMKTSGAEFMHLDATGIPADVLQAKFPTIYAKCLQKGIDLSRDCIPVVPAAHYLCGGIDVDSSGQTSIQRLFAIGECSHTGLHGANRLASNSLLEAIVYAHNAYQATADKLNAIDLQANIPPWDDKDTAASEEAILVSHNFREVQAIMSNYVGIVRTNARLDRAERRISLIYHETESFYQRTKLSRELCELRNIIANAYLIIKCAKIRKESRGLHYNLDYPNHLPNPYDTLL